MFHVFDRAGVCLGHGRTVDQALTNALSNLPQPCTLALAKVWVAIGRIKVLDQKATNAQLKRDLGGKL